MRFNEMPYQRPDVEKIKKEADELLTEFKQADSFEVQSEVMEKINELRNHISTMGSLASVRNSIDSNDEFYDKENTFFDQNGPIFQQIDSNYYKALNNSKFKDQLMAKWGEHIFNTVELELKTFSPEIMDDLKEENKYVSEYNKLTAKAKIMFEGKERNLSEMTPFLQNKSRSVRKEAGKALWGFFSDNEKELDDIYDRLVKIRTKIAKKLGYSNFIQLAYDRLNRSDYNAEMVKNYREQIKKHVVPIALELKKRQAKRIGIDDMKYYDQGFLFNSGNPDPEGTPQDIIDNAKEMYKEMSPETEKFFNFMLENQLMDLESKKGKRPGGYCTYFPDFKSPFIFSNFNGTRGDVDVLTHEAGHAFQSYCSSHHKLPEYQWPTLEACEIHSMSMEFFAWPWMNRFFGDNTEKYKFVHLSSSLMFLPYGACVDEFQHWIYENPEATPLERKQKYKELEKVYSPWVDYDGVDFAEKGGIWQKQLHIYCVPFYYIDYTLAQVCAFQFWKKDREDHENAWKDYLNLCKAGGSRSFVNLVKLANLDIPFEDGCIENVIHTIKEYLDSVDDTKF